MTTEAFAAVQQLRNSENDLQIIIPESISWTSPISGPAIVTCIGGGASGGAAYSSGGVAAAVGGSAGGTAKKKVTLVKDQSYTVTIGAGGAAVTSSVDGTPVDGNDGGDTTFTDGASLTIVGGGGNKGMGRASAGTVTGATGGTGTGGDLNFTGGSSGDATCTSFRARSGGGSVGLFADGHNSGDAVETDGTAARGAGADVGVDGDNNTNGDGKPKGAYGLGHIGVNVSVSPSIIQDIFHAPTKSCNDAKGSAWGCGGTYDSPGGLFAGGGGAGDGGNFGGGGGGHAANSSCTSGAGGNGVCVIEFRAERLYTS
jgi:hypothetical protein